MDIFGEARKAFKQAADGVSRGAESLRLDTDIAELSRLVAENYAAVGRRAQVLLRLGRVQDNELNTLVDLAEKSEEKLRSAQEAQQALRQGERIRRCPGCGEPIIKPAEFCGKCGRKLPVCPKCLEPLSAGDATCPSCGTAAEGTSPEPAPPTPPPQ